MRILIIEDDIEAASYLIKGLKEAGHVCDHAADGDEGYQKASDGGFDILIVDRMLPKRDGLSIIEGPSLGRGRNPCADPFGAWRGRWTV